MLCTGNAGEFSDIAAFGFVDSLWFRAGPRQAVTEEIKS